MKRLIQYLFLLMLSGSFSLFFGCSKDNDVVAKYQGGQITRKEFHDWLDSKRLGKEAILKKKSQQKNKLNYMVKEKLTVLESKEKGFDKDDKFQKSLEKIKRNFLSSYLRKKVRDEGTFSEEVVNAGIIKLQIKDYEIVKGKRKKIESKNLSKIASKKIEDAKNIISKLDKGEDFKKLAKEYSDDYTKRNGGDIGYISAGMRSSQFSKVAFNLKTGEYTKEPVKINNNIFIIKVYDKANVTEGNIDTVLKDKKQAERLKRRLLSNTSRNLESKLLAAKDAESYFDKISEKNKSTVLFKIGSDKFTIKDLDSEIEYLESKRGFSSSQGSYYNDERQRKSLARRIFREELLKREAIKRGIDKEADFLKEWEDFKNINLARVYQDEVVIGEVEVSDENLKEEYEKNKNRIYTKNVKKGKKTIKEPKKFSEVKEQIKRRLISRERAKKKRNWESELLKKYSFKILEDKLEGK